MSRSDSAVGPLPPGSELAKHWPIDPESVVFLNHGSFGACPRSVLEAQWGWQSRAERELMRFYVYELEGLLDSAREAVATFVGSAPEDLVFVSNATEGVNTVLRSLELSPGDEVLTTDQAYPACVNALRAVCDRAGARVVTVALPWPLSDPEQVVEAVLAGVTDRTRLAMLDHITSPTGLVLPIERVVGALRERGVETLVDGAHAPGQVALDLEGLGAAYYSANCHKWVCSPKGSAFLRVRRDRQAGVRPLVISHGATSPRTDRSRFLLEADWRGTHDYSSWLSIPDAIGVMGGMVDGGWDEVRSRNRSLALRSRALLASVFGTALPAPDSMVGSMASVLLPPGAGGFGLSSSQGSFENEMSRLQLALLERWGIQVPVIETGAGWHVRVSAQLYVSEAQMEYLGRAVLAACGGGS